MSLLRKIETIAKEMYGAKSLDLNEIVLQKLNAYESKVSHTNITHYNIYSRFSIGPSKNEISSSQFKLISFINQIKPAIEYNINIMCTAGLR